LPSSVDEIARFSYTYRRAILNALPIGAQKQLWRMQLESFRSAEAGGPAGRLKLGPGRALLTAHQQAIILDEIAQLDTYFDPTPSLADRRKASEFSRARVRGAFPDSLRIAVFYALGSPPRRPASTGPAGIPIASTVGRTSALDYCNCNYGA
jgi:hypothetical protein